MTVSHIIWFMFFESLVLARISVDAIHCFTCTYYRDINGPDNGCVENNNDRYLVSCKQNEICQSMAIFKNKVFSSLHRECRSSNYTVRHKCWLQDRNDDSNSVTKECFSSCDQTGCDRSLERIIENQWKSINQSDDGKKVESWVYVLIVISFVIIFGLFSFVGYRYWRRTRDRKMIAAHISYTTKQ